MRTNTFAVIVLLLFFWGCNSSNQTVSTSTVTQTAAPEGVGPVHPQSQTERDAHRFFIEGHKCRARGDLAESEEMFQKAYEILTPSDADHAKGSIANEYALALLKNDRPEKSIPVLREALAANTRANDETGIAVSHLNLGDALSRTGDRVAAEQEWEVARQVGQNSNNQSLVKAVQQRFSGQYK